MQNPKKPSDTPRPANIIGPAVPASVDPTPLALHLPAEVREGLMANRGIGDCPTCGAEPVRRNVAPEGARPIMVLIPCQHQLDAIAALDALKARHEQLARLKARLGSFAPPGRFAEVRLADVRYPEPNGDYAGTKGGLIVAPWFLANWPELRRKGAGMFFTGSPGTGKSMLSAAIANELDADGYYTAWFKIKSLFDRLCGDFAVKNRILEAVETCDLLVLDELISEKDTPAMLREVIRLLDVRFEAQRPTIVTSNFTLELVTAQIDGILTRENRELAGPMIERFRSRFMPPALKTVGFRGPDMRVALSEDWGPEVDA